MAEIYKHSYKYINNLSISLFEECICDKNKGKALAMFIYLKRKYPASVIKNFSIEKIRKASSFFKCSISVATLKAYQLRLISKDECNKMLQIIDSAAKKANGKGGNFYITTSSRLDHNFLSLLVASIHDGKTRYTDAYRMTGCRGASFNRLMLEVFG